MNKILFLIVFLFCFTVLQKKPKNSHTQEEIIIEFAGRLEDFSAQYHYVHQNKILPAKVK